MDVPSVVDMKIRRRNYMMLRLKMVEILKGMLYNLYTIVPNSVREFILMFENKFSLVLCDSPMGYVTRINRIDPLFLPEELDNINIKLLPILKTVYQARLTMEQTNKHVRKCVPEVKVTSKNPQFLSPWLYPFL